jgi:transposase InsO family protein
LTTSNALADTGANGYLFVSEDFSRQLVKRLGCEEFSDFEPQPVGGFDGSISQTIELGVRAHLTIQNRTISNEWLIVIDSPHDLIIGRKWFDLHDVLVDCKRRRLLFPPEWEPNPKWIQKMNIPLDQSPTKPPDPAVMEDIRRREKLMDEEDRRRRDGRAAVKRRIADLEAMVESPPKPRPGTAPRKVTILPRSGGDAGPRTGSPQDEGICKMERALQGSPPPPKTANLGAGPSPEPVADPSKQGVDAYGPYTLKRDPIGWYKARPPYIAMISAIAFRRFSQRKDGPHAAVTGITTLHEIDRVLELKTALASDNEDLRQQALEQVPACYHDFLDVFSKAESDTLPPFRPNVDHKIELLPGSNPEDLGYTGLWKLSAEELEAARKYITENLAKGFIEPSNAPWAAPILFALKGDGSLRFCVDYRKLNAMTKKDQYPLPLIDETLARIAQARVFTKIDIRQAFHRIRIAPESEDLTTFRTRYGAYKFKVMPFGLTNGPATFQRFINNTLMGYLDDFCSAYIDDILIFLATQEEHEVHVRRVLERLREAGLQADLKKCEFHVTETRFLGFIIGTGGVRPDPKKLDAVRLWQRPTTVKEVQSFLGFCNFYRRFVREYGRVARPLTNLTKKDTQFVWTDDCQHAFGELKKRLLDGPVLAHFRYGRPTRVETDASQGVVAGVLSQMQDDGQWHPIAYFSETMQGAEVNYHIHDKELLAVVRALQFWRAELIGLQNEDPFLIVSDHEALKYFSTKRLLNIRQAGWAELLSQYNFHITYRPGSENAAADALSRKLEDATTQKAKREAYRTMQIFAPVRAEDREKQGPTIATIMALDEGVSPPPGSGFQMVDDLLEANRMAPELEDWRDRARAGNSEFTLLGDRLLLCNGRLVVPTIDNLRTRVVQEAHSRLTTAHPGRNKTTQLVKARYWWPRMTGDIEVFVANCMPCRSSKYPRDKTPGLLKPIPPPQRSWECLVMDFKEFPPDKYGFDNALVMMDRLGKAPWTVPCKKSATARDAAKMYYEGPYRMFGLPKEVITDRGPQFKADFIDELSRILGIEWKLATAGHHQTAGQVENLNQYIDQRLRPYVSHFQDNWSRAIPAMDAVQMSLPHDSTGLQPHEVLFGFPMPMPFDWESRTKDFADCTPTERLSREAAQEAARRIQGYVDYARGMIQKAQDRQAEQANRHRREPDFDVGDRVVIVKQSELTSRPSDKLSFPVTQQHYEILEKTATGAYLLDVPESWRGSAEFTADRLRRYPNNPLPGQAAENPPGEDIAGEEEWEVEKILASRTHYGKLQYQAQWRGWDPDPAWYPASDFRNAPATLKRFHDDYPEQAGPPVRLDEWLLAAAEDRFAEPHPDDDRPAAGGRKLRRSRQKK